MKTQTNLSSVREDLYNELSSEIGNTPLVEYFDYVPNGNKIFIKEEYCNKFGVHYDRAYLALLKYYEEQERIKPGDTILDTTSGSAGASFAAIGKLLGYKCIVALPAGGEKARENAILAHEAEIIFTNKEQYISGFPIFLKKFLSSHKDIFFLNHSMGKAGTNNEITLSAFSEIATEAMQKIKVDYFCPAVGNGSTVLGPGRIFSGETKIVPFESFQSAVLYDLLYPGRYETKYGIKPGTLPRHMLPGTSFVGINFPHIRNAVNLISDAYLIADHQVITNYKAIGGDATKLEGLPCWDAINYQNVGRTTLGGIVAALKLSEKTHNKNYLIIGYDLADRYDS